MPPPARGVGAVGRGLESVVARDEAEEGGVAPRSLWTLSRRKKVTWPFIWHATSNPSGWPLFKIEAK